MKDSMRLKGRFQIEHRDKDNKLVGVYDVPNAIVDEGLNDILNVMFNSGTQTATWYIGLVDNAGFTGFANSDTMATNPGWDESTAYTEANRVAWGAGAAASRAITNATTADFNINATVTLHGIFITSDNTKGGTAGKLWSTAAFASNVTANNGDTLKITYSVTG
jgi:hypothetical protein